MRRKGLPEISREELEVHIKQYLDGGGKIKKLKAFEPIVKSKAFQQGHFHDLDNDSTDIGFADISLDG